MICPLDDLLEVAAIFVAEEREAFFLIFFLVSRVWLCKLANLASLELCIYRVLKKEKARKRSVRKDERFRDIFLQDICFTVLR